MHYLLTVSRCVCLCLVNKCCALNSVCVVTQDKLKEMAAGGNKQDPDALWGFGCLFLINETKKNKKPRLIHCGSLQADGVLRYKSLFSESFERKFFFPPSDCSQKPSCQSWCRLHKNLQEEEPKGDKFHNGSRPCCTVNRRAYLERDKPRLSPPKTLYRIKQEKMVKDECLLHCFKHLNMVSHLSISPKM